MKMFFLVFLLFLSFLSGCTTYVNPRYPNNAEAYYDRDYRTCTAYALQRIQNPQIHINSQGNSYTRGNVNVYDLYGNSVSGTYSSRTTYNNPMAVGADYANMGMALGTLMTQNTLREECMAQKGWCEEGGGSVGHESIALPVVSKAKKKEDEENYNKMVRSAVETFYPSLTDPEGVIQDLVKSEKSSEVMSIFVGKAILYDRCDVAIEWLDEMLKIDKDAFKVMTAIMVANGDCFKKDIAAATDLVSHGISGDLKSTYVDLFLRTVRSSNATISRASGFSVARDLAECGHDDSAGDFAILYLEGLGAPQSYDNAYIWFQVAILRAKSDFLKDLYLEKADYVKSLGNFSNGKILELNESVRILAQKIENNFNSSGRCRSMNKPTNINDYFISDIPFQGAGSVDNVIHGMKKP